MLRNLSRGWRAGACVLALTGLCSVHALAATPTPSPAASGPALPGAAAPAGAGDGFTVVQEGSYAPPVAAAPPPPKVIPRWTVPADTPLQAVLEAWAKKEGWRVYWPQRGDDTAWVTAVEVSFTAADFQEAATKFIEALPPEVGLSATFNRANSPKLLNVCESTCKQEIQ